MFRKILHLLTAKFFSVVIVPSNTDRSAVQLRFSLPLFLFALGLFVFGSVFMVFSTTKYIYTNYKTYRLQMKNAISKKFIANFEKDLNNYLVNYAPKELYVYNQQNHFPSKEKLPQQSFIGGVGGGYDLKWTDYKNEERELFLESLRNQQIEHLTNTSTLIATLKKKDDVFAISRNNVRQFSQELERQESLIAGLPLQWPVENGLGEIALDNQNEKVNISLLSGSTIVATAKGIIQEVETLKDGPKRIVISHPLGIETVFTGVFNHADIQKGVRVEKGQSIGKSDQNISYQIRINGYPVNTKKFTFIRY